MFGWASKTLDWLTIQMARRANWRRAGINTARIELPYHAHRKPSPGINFISVDLPQMIEATRQAISDTRALLGWLREQGCPSVGVWGISLGAWIGGLVACSEPRTG